MKIEHIGLWVKDLEGMRAFYEKYFEGKAGDFYHNKKTGFTSYFLTFPNGEARLEIMNKADLEEQTGERFGYAHLAYQVESKEAVDNLHKRLVDDGFKHVNGPRTTGDGYYEAVVEDPKATWLKLRPKEQLL